MVDPGLEEESASYGSITVTTNESGELCSLQKAEGAGLPLPAVMRCIREAQIKVRGRGGAGACVCRALPRSLACANPGTLPPVPLRRPLTPKPMRRWRSG